jgi:hypothetical protein
MSSMPAKAPISPGSDLTPLVEQFPEARLRRPESGRDIAGTHRLAVSLMAITLLAIWVYVLIRASDVAFTNDEAISYGIIHGVQTFVDSANNQWLNTWLMRVSQYAFGQSELALRLPNVAAFGLYGAALLALLSEVRHLEAKVIGFALLVINPFLLEFFGLARGYGLSSAFLMAAVACVVFTWRVASARRELGRLVLIGVFASLAFYANFSTLNVVLALLAVEISDLVVRGARREVIAQAGYRPAAAVVVCLTAASLVPGILQLRHLQAIGQLYYGGHTGFISDTIGSLLGSASCGYGCTPSWLTAGETLVVVIAVLAVAWAVVRCILTRAWSNVQRTALLLTIAVLAVLLESLLLGTLFPIDRTALSYVIAFAVLATFVINVATVASQLTVRLLLGTVTACFATLAAANFAQDANVTRTTIWAYDASSRQVINTIRKFERQHGRPSEPWKLIAGFPRNESLEYYRLLFQLSWLRPVTREPVATPDGDLYDVSVTEVSQVPRGSTILASFAETATELLVAPGVTREDDEVRDSGNKT